MGKPPPKLVVASDGKHTAIALDGVVLGRGIERLELSTRDEDGGAFTTIRLLEINVASTKVDTGEDAIERMLDAISRE